MSVHGRTTAHSETVRVTTSNDHLDVACANRKLDGSIVDTDSRPLIWIIGRCSMRRNGRRCLFRASSLALDRVAYGWPPRITFTISSKCAALGALVLRRLLLDVIDHQNLHRAFLQLKFQAELLAHGVRK